MSRLIDADALADNIVVLLERNSDMMGEWLANAIEDEITEAPTIDAEPVRHGHWIKMSDADGHYYACSECGNELTRIESFDPQFDLFPRLKSIDKTRYCSNCGARMDEVNDETN